MNCPPPLEVRLARDAGDLDAAQRLRYRVFHEEWGAHADEGTRRAARDADDFDAVMDHIVVIDPALDGPDRVVGTYRLLRSDRLGAHGFYSSHEFDLGPLLARGLRLLELGRSCVLREYRQRAALPLLWRTIAGYVAEHEIDLMFGCASLRGTDPVAVAEQLAWLHAHCLAPPELRPRARADFGTAMDRLPPGSYDAARAFRGLEPIIKGYVRAGAYVGEGAWVDHAFNAIDVCIVMPTERMSARYAQRFERGLARAADAAHASPMPVAARVARAG
jgi:putative hemolysin